MQQYRIAIAGCGPGGLASAILLARQGHHVELFERFDAPRPIGSGLLIQSSGQSILKILGLLDNIVAKGAPVDRLFGINIANGKRALDMEYRYLGQGAHAIGIHRSSLFAALYQAVLDAKIAVHCHHHLSGYQADGQRIRPIFKNSPALDWYDYLIDASGARSPLSNGDAHTLPYGAFWATVDRPAGNQIALSALEQRYDAAHSMAGIMPVGVNPASGNAGVALFWSVRHDQYDQFRDAGIAAWQRNFVAIWPEARAFAEQITSMDHLTWAAYHHRTGNAASHARLFHIGDAWHSTSPQLGQGANMALLDAYALSNAIAQAASPTMIAQQYRHARADHVALYQLLSRVFTPAYQSDSVILPWLRDIAVHHGARLPVIRKLIASIVSGNFANFGG